MDHDAARRRSDALASGALADVTPAAFAAGLALPTALTVEAHRWLCAGDAGALARTMRVLAAAVAAGSDGGELQLLLQSVAGKYVEVRVRLEADHEGPALTVMMEWEG